MMKSPQTLAEMKTRIEELEKKVAELSVSPRVESNSKTDMALYNALRETRMVLAAKLGIPIWLVASNAMLTAIVNRKPRTLRDLREIYGFGPTKVAVYGEEFLNAVADWS